MAFTDISGEDRLVQATFADHLKKVLGWGMREHVELLRQRGLPVPAENANPTVIVRNQQAEPAAI